MTQSPQPGEILTSESVKLLKAGDVLRHSDGRTGFYQSGTVGITVRSVYNGQWVFWPIEDQVTFIGRPDHEGWMPHHGGPNPVPGCVVETRSKFDSHDGPELSDRINWLNNYDFAQIIAFRIAAPSAAERVGMSEANEPSKDHIIQRQGEEIERLRGDAERFRDEYLEMLQRLSKLGPASCLATVKEGLRQLLAARARQGGQS